MVVGKPIWEVIKHVERTGSVIKMRVHCVKVKDNFNGKDIDFSSHEKFLRRDIHVLFLTQGVKCVKPDKIEFHVTNDPSMDYDYYVVDLTYDTDLDKEPDEHNKNFLNLLV